MLHRDLDGASVASREELHTRLAQLLSLPAWYGKNLDALYDCLTDLHEAVTLTLSHPAALEAALGPGYMGALLRALADAERDQPNFHFELLDQQTDKQGGLPMSVPLRCGPLSAQADPMGAELISLRDGGGTEYLWGGDPASWTGRNPNLFPIVGGLKDDSAHFGGVPIRLSRHGFARRSLFTVRETGEDFVVFSLRESPQTLSQYPFPFHLQIRHQLTEGGFWTQFTVENSGSGPLPFCVGGHTAFRCPLRPGERFEDYQLLFDRREEAGRIPLSPQGRLLYDRRENALADGRRIPLDHALFDEADTLIFEGLHSSSVRLVHTPTGKGVSMDFSQFPMVAFWTKPGANAPFLCLEPWHGCAALEGEDGEFAHKPHAILLSPGESRSLRYTVTLLP